MAEDRNIGDRNRKDMDRDRNQSRGSGSNVGQTGIPSDLDRGRNRGGSVGSTSSSDMNRSPQGTERKRSDLNEIDNTE